MKVIHGGDIYRNRVKLDYSVNVNPLGIPKEVQTALHDAVNDCGRYPDIHAEELRKAVSDMLGVPGEYLLFGNGASELFMALVHGIRPRRTVIPTPSFYGYEYAARAVSQDLLFYQTQKEDGFRLKEDLFEMLTEEVSLLFLANPNNPTGGLMSREYLKKLLCICREKGITVVLDECFIEFCEDGDTMISEIEQYENLILVRAFTKIFAIPGVRLGYLACSDQKLLENIKRQLPEWNLSVFAQAAGCACTRQKAFIKKTVTYVRGERAFLTKHLQEMGITVYPGQADFILLYSDLPLYDLLLERGILIRSCENFQGLSKGFYRIAVKSREENEILVKNLQELVKA